MPNLLDDRDKRTIYRKLKKEQYDSLINLSIRNGSKVRLLDEGAVVTANGDIDFYIEKGTLQKYLDTLPDDYEGTINLGHLPFSQFPFILGTWKKSDFELVSIGDGRHALDIALHLDMNSPFIKELHRANYDVGVSAEFYYDGKWKELQTEPDETEMVFCINEVDIKDFAIVGECGNVNSSGIELKGGDDLSLKDIFGKQLEVTEETTEEVTEDMTEETVEETVEETTEETTEETVDTDEIMASVSALKEEIEELKQENERLTEEMKTLKADNEEYEAFYKKLTVKLNPVFGEEEKKKEVIEDKSRYNGSDGIGEM